MNTGLLLTVVLATPLSGGLALGQTSTTQPADDPAPSRPGSSSPSVERRGLQRRLEDALAHRAEGRLAAAVDALQTLTTAAPTYADAHAELGMTLAWTEDFDGALAAYERALATGAGRGARLGRARVLAWAGHREEAIAEATRLSREDPDDAEPWRVLGTVHLMGNDRPRAERAFRAALRRQPDDAEALRGLEAARTISIAAVRVDAGVVGMPAAAVMGPFAAGSLTVRALPFLRLNSRYAFGATALTPFAAAASASHTLGASASLDYLNVVITGGLEVSLSPETGLAFATGRASYRVAPWLTVLGGVKPGWQRDHGAQVLTDAGVQLSYARLWALAQVYGWVDISTRHAATSLLTLGYSGESARATVGGGLGELDGGLTSTLTASTQLHLGAWPWLGDLGWLGVRYEGFNANVLSRHAVAVYFEVAR